MAWCYYCRRYTVNGQCPNCGRIYEFPGKRYDFYGREIVEKKPEKKKSSSSSSSTHAHTSSNYVPGDHYFAGGFWLAMAISFGAILIANARGNRKMRNGAIVGTIVQAVLITEFVLIIISSFLNGGFAWLKDLQKGKY